MTNSRINTRVCPRCHSEISQEELICPFCNYEFDDVWKRQVQKSKPRWERLRIWFKARIRRGERRHEELATSPRYHNALVKLRLKYNVPCSGFSAEAERKAWELWLCRELDSDIEARKRSDRCIVNRLRRDCEKLTRRFRIVGDWTIVRRHMLCDDAAIKDFEFGEGWSIDFAEDEPKLIIRPNATQETIRSGRRFLRSLAFHKQRSRYKP